MKIERISDNQIRCTLNKEDLIDRQLKISELAYGSDKAKALFRDMMQQASNECNFEADDIPLMIEAIPVSPDCLVLVITKVTDPDELDTRFSNFTAAPPGMGDPVHEPEENAYADEILSCFEHISEILGEHLSAKALGNAGKTTDKRIKQKPDKETDGDASVIGTISKIYSFSSLQEVIDLSKTIRRFYNGENTLYKDTSDSVYYLVVNISDHTAGEFNKVCNIISEYGKTERVTCAGMAYFQEHYEVIVKDKAIQVLSKM